VGSSPGGVRGRQSEVGAGGDVVVWAGQGVGDGFSRGLSFGNLFVEVGDFAVGDRPPAVDA
jgi:hypothetical protein